MQSDEMVISRLALAAVVVLATDCTALVATPRVGSPVTRRELISKVGALSLVLRVEPFSFWTFRK